MPEAIPFLRIPPFPGHRAPPLTGPLARPGTGESDPAALAAALRRERVGGAFWGARPAVAPGTIVLAPDDAAQLAEMRLALPAGTPTLIAPPDSDPWHLAGQAAEIWAGSAGELALVAGLAGTPVRQFGAAPDLAAAIDRWRYASPFDGGAWTALEAIAQLGAWRRQIDANRGFAAIYGVTGWKRVTVDALLWDGTGPVRHARALPHSDAPVLAWKSRTAPAVLAALAHSGTPVGEVEDGFIRSAGLGANCVPPLSIIVDSAGVYFDPAQPSDLETLLADTEIDEPLRKRARALRERLVAGAISKYAQGDRGMIRPAGTKRRILVTGQVEDDRSIISGGAGLSNRALLARARELEGPDAFIIYKPHPDVEAGHRTGRIPDAEALRHADEIERTAPITALLDTVDGLHCITSLAGFEALLRGKAVTTHGTPFYAGWGLTRDLAPLPARRGRPRDLDELVAATLLLYPRYLDPVTRLPCPAEVLVERMAVGQARITSPLVVLRQWQGRAQGWLRRLTGGR